MATIGSIWKGGSNVAALGPEKQAELAQLIRSFGVTESIIEKGVRAAQEYKVSHSNKSGYHGNTHDLVVAILQAALEPEAWHPPQEPAA